MNSLVNNMNKEQSEAVRTTEGPLIMAGAGSGKTRGINTSYRLFIR